MRTVCIRAELLGEIADKNNVSLCNIQHQRQPRDVIVTHEYYRDRAQQYKCRVDNCREEFRLARDTELVTPRGCSHC